jgi:hypothetical protein
MVSGSLKWQQHVTCTQLIRRHPDWDDERVRVAADLRPLEMNIVQEARREVDSETVDATVQTRRSY